MTDDNLQIYHHRHHSPDEVLADEKTQGPWMSLLRKYVGSIAGQSVLDVGCGFGGLMMACYRLGAYSVGVEPSHIVQVTRQGIVGTLGKPLPLVCADGRALPFKTGSFDVVVSIGVLEHITEPNALVKEMARVLKPEGKMLLYFGPNGWWRLAQSPSHRKIVLTYWTTGDAERKMRAVHLSDIKRVWTDVIDYRFRNDSFTNGKATLYGKLARFLEKGAKKTPVRKTVVLTCKALEMASFPRNVGLIASGQSRLPGVDYPSIDFSDIREFVHNLVCPACKSDLELSEIEKNEREVVNGSLYCSKCDNKYQIVDGIPKFLFTK
jgi:SAM-dependent methyltransferase/uncharacterized protein YbaR (Trm112 family)